MTSLLLDTHAVLWFWWDDSRLSATAKDAIRDPENRTLVSFATPWEVAIKVSRKRLDIGGGFRGYFDQHMVRTFFRVAADSDQALGLGRRTAVPPQRSFRPAHRGSGVDRRIGSGSADVLFDPYGVTRLW